MSFGNIIGQILQQGMASQGRSRLEHTLGSSGLGGGGLGDLLGATATTSASTWASSVSSRPATSSIAR